MVDTVAACNYAAEDADVTWQLWQYLSTRLDGQPAIKKLFEEVEMPLMQVLARMEANGVSLDCDLLRTMSRAINKQIDELADKIYQQAGFPFNIDSTKQLAEVLFDRLGLQSIRQGKTQRSTDADVLEQLSGQHPIVPLVLEYRQLVKLQNTYLDKLPLMINPRTQRLHASFNQTITATGRLSSSDPNLQNIPVRTELGRQIRSAFVPADRTHGCILSADYSQIELRLLLIFPGCCAVKGVFRGYGHSYFVASQIYGVEAGEVTSEMRGRPRRSISALSMGRGLTVCRRQSASARPRPNDLSTIIIAGILPFVNLWTVKSTRRPSGVRRNHFRPASSHHGLTSKTLLSVHWPNV
jgi:DNA polymerase-1